MGILHRLFRAKSAAVWEAETRLMHRLGLVRPPVAVQWISTSACDLKCPHCYSNAGRPSPHELTTEQAKAHIIDSMTRFAPGKKDDLPTLVIAGGETLLRRDFNEIVAYAYQQGVPWAIHTHGGLVEKHLHTFEKYPPLMAAVSVDGPRAYHDDFRGKIGSYDAAVRAIEALKRIGVGEVVAGTTINRKNADLLADMIPEVLGSGADSWGFHLMTPEGRANENQDLLPTATQLRRVASLGRRLRSIFHVELDNEWGSAGDDDCFYRDAPFMCGAGRVTCVISATGELMPCTTTDIGESAGNVCETPLAELWAAGFERFRGTSDALRGDIHDCWLNTRHGVSCRKAAFTTNLYDDTLTQHNGATLVPMTIEGTR